MAANSFFIKGWTVTLVSAFFALAAKDANGLFFVVAYLPASAFWILDSYYLWQEKLFRDLFDKVRNQSEIDFSMDTSKSDKSHAIHWVHTAFSRSLLIFYGVILVAISIACLSNSYK